MAEEAAAAAAAARREAEAAAHAAELATMKACMLALCASVCVRGLHASAAALACVQRDIERRAAEAEAARVARCACAGVGTLVVVRLRTAAGTHRAKDGTREAILNTYGFDIVALDEDGNPIYEEEEVCTPGCATTAQPAPPAAASIAF